MDLRVNQYDIITPDLQQMDNLSLFLLVVFKQNI